MKKFTKKTYVHSPVDGIGGHQFFDFEMDSSNSHVCLGSVEVVYYLPEESEQQIAIDKLLARASSIVLESDEKIAAAKESIRKDTLDKVGRINNRIKEIEAMYAIANQGSE